MGIVVEPVLFLTYILKESNILNPAYVSDFFYTLSIIKSKNNFFSDFKITLLKP